MRVFVPSSERKRQRAAWKAAYRLYLDSPEWKRKRQEVLAHFGNKCYECGKAGGNQVHHLRYAKRWGDELMCDFRVLCRDCHRMLHPKKKKVVRKKKRQRGVVLWSRDASGKMKPTKEMKRLHADILSGRIKI
jgi:RNase P subunit RPR2